MRLFLCYIGTLLSFRLLAQIDPVVNSDKQEVGKPFILIYEVSKSSRWTFPKLKKNDVIDRNLEIVGIQRDTISEKIQLQLKLIAFDSGNYVIPSYPFKRGTQILKSSTKNIHVSRIKVDDLKEPLHDIKPIKAVEWAFNDYFNKYRWVIIGAAAGLLLIVLAFIIYPWIKNKKYAKKRNRKILPAEEALHALSKLKQQKLWEKSTKAYYSELTNALRVYFEKKLKIDALESTSDEILEKMNPKLEKEEHQKLKTLLYESDMVKFAKSSPGESKHLNYMEDSVALIHSVEEKMDENTPYFECLGEIQDKLPKGDFAIWWKTAEDDLFTNSVSKKVWSEFYLQLWDYHPYLLGKIYLEKGLNKEQKDVFLPESKQFLALKSSIIGTFLLSLSKEKGIYILMDTERVEKKAREQFLNSFIRAIRRFKKELPAEAEQTYKDKKYNSEAVEWYLFMEKRMVAAEKNRQGLNKLGGKKLK